MTTFKTITEIKNLNKAKGGFFFSAGARRFFNSRNVALYRGRFLLTSEQFSFDTPRFFNLRCCLPSGDIETLKEFKTRQQAKNWISELYSIMGYREKAIIENLVEVYKNFDFGSYTFEFSDGKNRFLLDVDSLEIVG